jgi:hypothetical protein
VPQPLIQIFSDLQRLAVETAPKLLLALLALIALLFTARLVETLLRRLLVRLPIDRALEQAGAADMLRRAGVQQAAHLIIPRLVYYLLLLLFARVAADAYGLVAISSAIGALFGYLPKLAAALLLLIIGSTVSKAVSAAVTRSAESSGIDFASTLGRLAGAFVLFVVGAMAIGQLEFDTAMVRIVAACIMGGFALAFALSIGLGTRELTRNVLAGFYARKLFRPGDVLEVRGQRGALRAITPTQTVLMQDGVAVTFSNSIFLDDAVKGNSSVEGDRTL